MSDSITMSVRAEGPPGVVHAALTQPAAMVEWLSEFADVELPHHYRFWGRYVPDGEEPRQTLVAATDTSLRFQWLIADRPTTATIELKPLDDLATAITVTQEGFDAADLGPLGQLQTFWALALANLVDLVEERDTTPRADLTSTELRAAVDIAAPTDAVFDSLISSEKVSAWFGFPIEIEPREGGRFGSGRIVELDPDRGMSVDFPGTGIATWTLEGSGGHTRLTIAQSGFDSNEPPYTSWMGVLSGIAELRRFHELTDWRPIWLAEEGNPA
ncbi:SRPBCC domain-containing protein [Microbacterium sp. HD4P20]|uniref:SRPBCC family protein n=1 Tax=Microbacterium sp. HD4P20 TaxID=2864874 RepID=UPI001C640237|nr:SRPBCC family protein [Microbacterium sp. HD4P20]MCP2637441.1 SRPBCC domain-containing protein [Microbacterium sp. HD4P20]